MRKYKSNSQKYSADCSKCGMLHTGTQYYFQKDIKEKCFCGAELIHFRSAGEKWTPEMEEAQKRVEKILADVEKSIQLKIQESIANWRKENN